MAALSFLVVGVSGCGNLIEYPSMVGQIGITVDQAGQPVIAVMTCAKATPLIQMSEGRKPSDPDNKQNVQRGSWQGRAAFAGVKTIALTAADDDWVTASSPGTLEPDRMFIIDGSIIEEENTTLGGVSFRTSDLTRLSPNQVQMEGRVESLNTFSAYQCPDAH